MRTRSIFPLTSATAIKKYGITEAKKAELDALTIQVIDAQYEVNQYQSMVTSLTNKVSNFQAFLTTAQSTRTETYNNRTLVNQLAQSTHTLRGNAQIAFDKMADANVKTKSLSRDIKEVIDKLIYSAEMLNKLAAAITRKKALNPLISDELIGLVATAGTDANNAVALTLIALKSTFAAQASNMESESAVELAYTDAIDLYNTLTGKIIQDGELTQTDSLDSLVHTAYNNAKANYTLMEQALAIATNQLNEATLALNKAQAKLTSLQSGLAAANAAALAS
jgi:hypothetical protein